MVFFTCFVIKGEADNAVETLSKREFTILKRDKPHYKDNFSVGFGFEYVSNRIPNFGIFEERKDSIFSTNKNSHISNYKREKELLRFDLETPKKDTLELPLNYYKGYKAILNGEEIAVKQSNLGLVEIIVEKSGHIEVKYEGTMLQKASFVFNILILLAIFIYTIILHRKNNEKN